MAVTWYDARNIGVEGKGYSDTEGYYDRLPGRAHGLVRQVVWDLSRQSAGMCVHFATDSASIHVRWTLRLSRLAMPHMAATGISGVDLYALDDAGRWRWLAVGQPDGYPVLEQKLVDGLAPGLRQYRLYLPLYNGVESVEIGVDKAAVFQPIPPRTTKPIVFYGSSIVQGACASRPGMHHVAILGRRLNQPVVNLGFSGNALMEPELAQLVAELDPSIFVLDALPNMNAALIAERFAPFVRTLRSAHTETPIVLVEDRAFTNTLFLPAKQAHHAATRQAWNTACAELLRSGVKGLHLVERDNLYGRDGEASVDGSHPTDLGFVRMADALEPVLSALL